MAKQLSKQTKTRNEKPVTELSNISSCAVKYTITKNDQEKNKA